MGSATSHKPHVALGPRGIQREWPVFVCQQGAFLFDPRAHHPVDPAEAVIEYSDCVLSDPRRGFVALPPCRDKDTLLNQPALGLQLSQDEAEKLIADTTAAAGAIAATDIGPVGQDKESNQDFALAATIRVVRGGAPAVYQFAAVADGVTTRTLWPERSARLAAFAAWRVARRHVEDNRNFSHEAFDGFRDALVREIKHCLECDIAMLIEAGTIPAGWARDTYAQCKGRRELWYNSTLHVALVGPDAGFVLSCGDGGLVVRKRENGETKSVVLVRSTDDISVSGIVSLAPNSMRFSQTRIAINPETSVDIIIATDGVDRSLRRDAGNDDESFDPYGAEFVSSLAPKTFKGLVDTRLGQIATREIDNISSAVLHWPPPTVLPTPLLPGFIGPIVAVGEGVDEVNARIEARHNLLSRARAQPRPPTGKTLPQPTADVVPPPAVDLTHPAGPKDPLRPLTKTSPPHGSRLPEFRKSASALRDPAALATPVDRRAEPRWNRADIELAIRRTFDLCDLLPSHLSDGDRAETVRQVLSTVPSVNGELLHQDFKSSRPIFCKAFFYLLAMELSSGEFQREAQTSSTLEHRLDECIKDYCGVAPRIKKEDITLLRRHEIVVPQVLDILRHKALAREQIAYAVDAFRRL
jgi:protein phosphatase 2C-like protein